MSSSRQWTKEETASFIFQFENCPELWNVSSEIYKDRAKRARSLQDLATEFNTDTKEISRKLHNLRTQLNSELRKAKKRKCGADDVYRSGWQFFEALQFLVPMINCEDRPTSSLGSESAEGDADNSVPPPAKPRWPTVQKKEDVLDTSLLGSQTKDEDQIFGDFVASSLRSIESSQLKKQLKLKIQRAVLEVGEMDIGYFE